MLRVNNLTGFGGGTSTPATAAFLQFNSDIVDRTTYTFAGEDIGTPGTQRHIGVAIHVQDAGGSTINSVTVDGESLDPVVTATASGGQLRLALWFGAVDTANATGDIVITLADAAQLCLIGVYECHYVQSATATATDTETTDNTQMTAANSAGGIALAASSSSATTDTWTWTGDVTDHGQEQNDDSLSIASGALAAAGTATATANAGTGTNYIAVFATFR